MPIYLTDDLTLIPYTTTKVDAKKGICRMHGHAINIDPMDLANIDFSTFKND
jgi:serum/glucocorticoid-regulated kinase 2